jgi:hypothetical protein
LIDKNFAYVFGRTDAIRLLSNIYIEDVQYCLEKSKISNKLTGNFKYGLQKSGLKNILRLEIYLKEGMSVSQKQQEEFQKEFYRNLIHVNPDFKMVSSGISFSFNIEFCEEPEIKYKGGKFDYFIN